MNGLIKWWFADKDGNIVIAQKPNVPILLWFVSWPFALLLPEGTTRNVIYTFSMVSLAVWAVLELAFGVNRFRRLLGLVVLTVMCLSVFV